MTAILGNDFFILALHRFLAKPKKAKLIISDKFRMFKSENAKLFLRNNCINQSFILDLSFWWGRFCERLVGITKFCLKKVVAKALIIFEELRIVTYEVEVTLNSRPLT